MGSGYATISGIEFGAMDSIPPHDNSNRVAQKVPSVYQKNTTSSSHNCHMTNTYLNAVSSKVNKICCFS